MQKVPRIELSCSTLKQLGLRVTVFHTEENVLSSVCFPRGDREVISRSPGMLWPSLVWNQGTLAYTYSKGRIHVTARELLVLGTWWASNSYVGYSLPKASIHSFLYPRRLYIAHLIENKFTMKEKPPTSMRLFLVNDHFNNKGKLVTLS